MGPQMNIRLSLRVYISFILYIADAHLAWVWIYISLPELSDKLHLFQLRCFHFRRCLFTLISRQYAAAISISRRAMLCFMSFHDKQTWWRLYARWYLFASAYDAAQPPLRIIEFEAFISGRLLQFRFRGWWLFRDGFWLCLTLRYEFINIVDGFRF